ncbi:MAG: tetratricopeptide repeat protein [Clostridia bacterium]|nr:tetratricopeptide repeat protein [Clostridia bacterium]
MSERDKKNDNVSRIGRVISISGSVNSLIDRGDELSEKGDFLSALKLYRRALRLRPQNDDTRLRVADTLLDMNCFAEAAGVLAPVLRQGSPILRLVIFRLAHCMLGRSEFRAARQLFMLAVTDGDEDDVSEELSYEEMANAFECIGACEQYVDSEAEEKRFVRDSDEVELERVLEEAGKLSEQGRFDEAIPLAEGAYERHPDSMELFTDLLLNYYCDRRLDEGKKLYETAPQRFKRDFTVQCCAALIFGALGESERVEKLVSAITSHGLEQINDIVRAYTVMMEIGRFEKASEYAEDLCDIEPYNRNFIHFAAQAAYCLNDISYAKQCYERCLAIEPSDSVAYFFKKTCLETLESGERIRYQIEYTVPPAEFLRRVERSEEIANMSRDEVAELYDLSRDEVLRLTDWALNDKSSPYGDMYLAILEQYDPELAEALIRRIIVEPESSKAMKRAALAHLNSIAPNEKFMLYSDGNVNVCSFGKGADSFAEWPECYRRIAELACSRIAEKAPDLLPAAAKLCYLYTLGSYKKRPRLPFGQPEAMAAAIEYFLLKENENYETPNLHAFAAERGVTVRRISNALVRLLTTDFPDGFPFENTVSESETDWLGSMEGDDDYGPDEHGSDEHGGRFADLINIADRNDGGEDDDPLE